MKEMACGQRMWLINYMNGGEKLKWIDIVMQKYHIDIIVILTVGAVLHSSCEQSVKYTFCQGAWSVKAQIRSYVQFICRLWCDFP